MVTQKAQSFDSYVKSVNRYVKLLKLWGIANSEIESYAIR